MQNELFEYEINDESVTIVKYLGHEPEVTIPPEIDGRPVTKIGSRAFAGCTFLKSVIFPSCLSDIAEDAFDNFQDLDFYELDQSDDTDSEEGDDELRTAEPTTNSESVVGTFHSRNVTSDDFRQPFPSKRYLRRAKSKGAVGLMAETFFKYLPVVLFLLLVTVLADIVLSAGLTGWISFGIIEGTCLKDTSGIYHSENMRTFGMILQIVSLLFLFPFFTGVIRIIYTLTLNYTGSWKLFFSGFDRSFFGIAITWILFCASLLSGAIWLFYGTEFLHYPPQYTCPPLFFISIPISVFLLAVMVIQAGKRVNLFKAMSVAFSFAPKFGNILSFIVFMIISVILGYIFLFSFLSKENPFAASLGVVFLFTLPCVLMFFYYVAVFTKTYPEALENDLPETRNQSPKSTAGWLQKIFLLGCSLFVLAGLIPAYQILSGKIIDQLQQSDPELVLETDSSMFEYGFNNDGVEIKSYIGTDPEVRIPSKINGKRVTSIRISSYGNDYSFVTSVVIPEGVTVIDDYAFKGCSSLTSVVIPESVTKIGTDAFMDCSSLESVTIPKSVTEIKVMAFWGCTSLKYVEIPESVTNIEGCVFVKCPSLTIRAPEGSKAEEYAKEKGIPFEAL